MMEKRKVFNNFKFGLKLVISFLIINSTIQAQLSRTEAMGGLTFSIIDRDQSLNLFDFGGNPAWLIEDELQQRLEVTPSINNSWGQYRRPYSAEGTYNYRAGFIGIKPLGESGTFRGKADYNYEIRRNNYRTLKKDTYAGEAFYFIDTTSGDVRFNGPRFEFMHSLELFDDLYLGASAAYQIMDGLKKVYTYAETLYRNVDFDIGTAYRVSDDFTIGVDYRFTDTQERIKADDVNLLTVETYHFRGETFAIQLSGSSQNYKLKKQSNSISSQLNYRLSDNLEFGLKGSYAEADTRILFPVSSLIDVEDGFASFNTYKLNFAAAYYLSSESKIGVIARYNNYKSWSKNTERELLLWEWDIKDLSAGIGYSTLIKDIDLLLGVEYQITSITSDSSKHVDNKFIKEESVNHSIRTGIEYYISNDLTIRAGYSLNRDEHDFIYGGDNFNQNLFTLGGGFKLFENILLDLRLEYSVIDADLLNQKVQRKIWGSFFTLRFSSF